MDYNPVRWVCQFQNNGSAVCNGQFRPTGYGGKRGTRCRLYDKCHGVPHQMETTFFAQYKDQKQLKLPGDMIRSRAHDLEQIALRRCFDPDCRKDEAAKRYKEKPWYFKRQKRPYAEMAPGYIPLTKAKGAPPPPCGGDCANCPWDDRVCRYPDWDEAHDTDRTARRRANKKWYQGVKAKNEKDPQARASYLEKQRAYAKKARAKHKFIKNGGNPYTFEVLWAKGKIDDKDMRLKQNKKGGSKHEHPLDSDRNS